MLMRVSKKIAGGTGSAIFISVANGQLSDAVSGTTTVSTPGSSGTAKFVSVNTGGYNTLTFTGVTSYLKAIGVKADGTNAVITPSGNVFDLTDYVSAIITADPVTGTITASLS